MLSIGTSPSIHAQAIDETRTIDDSLSRLGKTQEDSKQQKQWQNQMAERKQNDSMKILQKSNTIQPLETTGSDIHCETNQGRVDFAKSFPPQCPSTNNVVIHKKHDSSL